MLRLTLQADTDGTGELFVEASSGAFHGASSAWFEMRWLAEFGRILGVYPLPREKPPTLQGGYWREGAIEERHVGLTFRQVDLRGTVGIHIELATPRYEGERPEHQSRAAFEILTDYESLRRFGQALTQLADGRADEACLESVASAR
jgi:hypothetical protein